MYQAICYMTMLISVAASDSFSFVQLRILYHFDGK